MNLNSLSDPTEFAHSAARNVSVTLESDNRVAVRIGDETRTGDTYYLGLDALNDVEDSDPIPALLSLLDGWLAALLRLRDGDLIYLPFDFSDEYTRWVACQASDNELTAVFGWAEVEGWAISPTDFSQYVRDLDDFRADEPIHPQTFYRPRFIGLVRRSQAILRSQRVRPDRKRS